MSDIPGEASIKKLFETVERCVGALFGPWQIRREGRARNDVRRDELLMLEQVQQDINDIRAGRKQLDDKRRLVAPTKEREEPYLRLPSSSDCRANDKFPALMDAAKVDQELRQTQRMINLQKTILKTEELIEDFRDTEVSDKPVESDWFEKWRSGAEAVANEDVQRLWASILAGEIKQPGLFSLRTLTFLQSITKSDADLITKMGNFVLDGHYIWRDDDKLHKFGITLNDLLALEELGILIGREAVGGLEKFFESSDAAKFRANIIGHKNAIVFVKDDPNGRVTIPAYLLSAIGRQVMLLGVFEDNIEYLRALALYIKQNGFDVRIGEITADRSQARNLTRV